MFRYATGERHGILLMISAEPGFVNKNRIGEIMGLTVKSCNMNRAFSSLPMIPPAGKA